MDHLQDITHDALLTASSADPPHTPSSLIDPSPGSFWQSLGSHPHSLTLHFRSPRSIHSLQIYADHALDESYTPRSLRVMAGSDTRDLTPVLRFDIDPAPSGWVSVPLESCLDARVVRIEFLANFENGKDTRLRVLRVLAPAPSLADDARVPFTSPDFYMYSAFR